MTEAAELAGLAGLAESVATNTGKTMERAGWNIVRKGWRWIVLIPLLMGASLTFLQYAGWAAVFSGNFGLRQWLVNEAGTKAEMYGWAFVATTLCSIGIVITLLPSFEEEYYSGAIALMHRLVLASLLVLASELGIFFTLLAIGHHLG